MTTKNGVLVLVLSFVFVFSATAGAKNGFYPTHFSPFKNFRAQMAAGPTKLLYYGGPVIASAKVYSVYWGANVDKETRDTNDSFYWNVVQSSYVDWLDEYNTLSPAVDGRAGTQQHISHGTYVGAITITPANTNVTIDDTDVQAELQHQMDIGALPKADDNTLYMVYFPAGMTIAAFGAKSCVDFCAYHSFKGAPNTDHFFYGVMPDIGGSCSFGCSSGSNHLDGVDAISSHEMLEAITDPFPTPGSSPAYPQAWNTSDGMEIGDLCVGTTNKVVGASTFTVQGQWDNAISACTAKDWPGIGAQ